MQLDTCPRAKTDTLFKESGTVSSEYYPEI